MPRRGSEARGRSACLGRHSAGHRGAPATPSGPCHPVPCCQSTLRDGMVWGSMVDDDMPYKREVQTGLKWWQVSGLCLLSLLLGISFHGFADRDTASGASSTTRSTLPGKTKSPNPASAPGVTRQSKAASAPSGPDDCPETPASPKPTPRPNPTPTPARSPDRLAVPPKLPPAEPALPRAQPVAPSVDWGSQARLKAESYLDYTSFSRQGLVDQLVYEGFSAGDATSAVNSLSVDWTHQARLKAGDYLAYTSFSRQGLIEQLEYDGFSHSDATARADSPLASR